MGRYDNPFPTQFLAPTDCSNMPALGIIVATIQQSCKDLSNVVGCRKGDRNSQGVTKRCRLSWLTNSARVYEPKCGGGGVVGSKAMSTGVHMEPK